jgi:predicted dehydrogenase
MSIRLNWGIISTGGIAATFAAGVAASKTGRVVAVGSRTADSAKAFAARFGIARAHPTYEALLADPEVQAVYIGTPHPQHIEWAVKAAQAGKHVLCEKPLGMNLAEGLRIVEATRKHGVLLMEAFMYRCHPQTAKVAELVRTGALGQVGLVQATFSFYRDFDPNSRHFAKVQGGGGILDVGCYPVSFSRLVAGATVGQAFLDPVEISGFGFLHPQTGIDVVAAATLRFGGGLLAQVSCGVGLEQDNSVRVYGTQGWLHIPRPWHPTFERGRCSIWLHRVGKAPEEIVFETEEHLYGMEADAFANALATGARDVPQMSVADTLGNLTVLDRWLRDAGVKY